MRPLKDLAMGMGFAVRGGREGWVRTVLTAVGVGLGVALLLLAGAVPTALAERDVRSAARAVQTDSAAEASARTFLVAWADTRYHGQYVTGLLVRAEGADPVVPPGLTALPGPGEMAVSPALNELLAAPEGALLRERLGLPITAVIGEAGLVSPGELVYYAGSETIVLGVSGAERATAFGLEPIENPLDPMLALLVLIGFTALLMPVVVFIATAVRFGGERRDRRLAALRLVGADSLSVRRIAAGEALAGALLGLGFGAAFFFAGRQAAGGVSLFGSSVFPADLNTPLAVIALVAVGLPVTAVVVAVLALRGVVIEPLGVMRKGRQVRRRIWWRLLPPVAGAALLLPLSGNGESGVNGPQAVAGTLMLLVGVTALLPWVVEAAVRGLHGAGGVSWQLAVRRLQLDSGSGGAARQVNGIAVAVAGAIALYTLFAGIEGHYVAPSGHDTERAQLSASGRFDTDLSDVDGVTGTVSLHHGRLSAAPGTRAEAVNLTVGSCKDLREIAELSACQDGDTFIAHNGESGDTALARPGARLYVESSQAAADQAGWVVPDRLTTAELREDPFGQLRGGILATPAAVADLDREPLTRSVFIRVDPAVPDVVEHVRNAVYPADPTASVSELVSYSVNDRFADIRTGLLVGATCVLALIGASLLVGQVEQLRERRKLLSTLVAFGTRRTTLSLSVLWQTAIPIALGLALAIAVGSALGAALLRMVGVAATVDWTSIGLLTSVGGGVVLAVTALSLVPLVRLMRPDGIRTE